MKLSRAAFEELRTIVHRLCGLVVPDEKEYLIHDRLSPVAEAAGCNDFDSFCKLLRGSGGITHQMAIIDAITTRETSFFRDSHPFEAIRKHVLPEFERRRAGTTVRVRMWCAACSTGQEPYSLAFTLAEHLSATPISSPLDYSIFATDISEEAIRQAEAAEYEEREVLRGLSAAQIVRYFERNGSKFRVRPDYRALVRFRRMNLLQPQSGLGIFDLILCRNLLIYFDIPTRTRLVQFLSDSLTPGGYLLVGAAENLFGISDQFEIVWQGATALYRKPLE